MMPNRLHIIGLLLLALLTAGCDNKSHNPLRIAHNSWPGYEPLVLAESESLYGDVEVINYRVGSSTKAIQAFEHNIVDVVAITLDEALLLQDRYPEPLVVFAVLDISHGGDAIVAKQGIKTLSDLRGKHVGVEDTALGGFFLSRALDALPELSIADIQIVPITVNHHHAAFVADEIDAVVTFEPVKTALIKHGGNVLFDSTMIPNEIVDVLVTHKPLTEQRSDDLRTLVRGYFEAQRLIQKHPDKMHAKMADFEEIYLEDFRKSLSGLKIPNETVNHHLLGGAQPQLRATIEKLQQFLSSKMNTPARVVKTLILSDEFIPVVNHVK